MHLKQTMFEEINLLLCFPHESLMQGLKVHTNADPKLVEAAKRLYEKGIIDHVDGGYLTDLGQDLYSHAKKLEYALNH